MEPNSSGSHPAFEGIDAADVQHAKTLLLDEKRWSAPNEEEIYVDYVNRYQDLLDRWASAGHRGPSRTEAKAVLGAHPIWIAWNAIIPAEGEGGAAWQERVDTFLVYVTVATILSVSSRNCTISLYM